MRLGDRRDGRDGGRLDGRVDFVLLLAVAGSLLDAVPRDVSGLPALVASLASSVERAAVGRRAVTADMPQLAAGIALHGLRLAVAGKVVRAAALVAGGLTSVADKAAAAMAEAATADGAAPGEPGNGRVGAVALDTSQYLPSDFRVGGRTAK